MSNTIMRSISSEIWLKKKPACFLTQKLIKREEKRKLSERVFQKILLKEMATITKQSIPIFIVYLIIFPIIYYNAYKLISFKWSYFLNTNLSHFLFKDYLLIGIHVCYCRHHYLPFTVISVPYTEDYSSAGLALSRQWIFDVARASASNLSKCMQVCFNCARISFH